jgi:hypothetical protein
MPKVDQPRRVRPPLPRLVEQVRILLWMQTFLSVFGLLVCLLDGRDINRLKLLSSGDAYRRLSRLENQVELVILGLATAAILLAVCAPLVRRRWPPVHLFALAVEVGILVLAISLIAARIGPVTTTFMILYAALSVWIVVDLFRGEVLRHLWRIGGRHGPGEQDP